MFSSINFIKNEYTKCVKIFLADFFIKNKLLKALYRIMLIFLAVCWLFIGLFFVTRVVKRQYIYPLEYKQTVFTYADYYGLDRALVFAVIKTESNFDKNALSNKGAKGLMQITDNTAKYIAQKLGAENYDVFNEETNVNFGCFYIKYLLNRFNDLELAIVAYNAGEGNVSLWLSDRKNSQDGKTLQKIPFKETREYLEKIKVNLNNYKKLYGKLLDKQINIE